MRKSVAPEMFKQEYADVFEGDEHWKAMPVPDGELFPMGRRSRPTCASRPIFDGMTQDARARSADINGARVLALLGDSRDHRPHFAGRQHRQDTARRRTI